MGVMSKMTASYLAGFIDGEGYLGIVKNNVTRLTDECRYYPTIKVANTNPTIIYFLKNSFGGYLNIKKRKLPWKDVYTWETKGRQMEKFLKKIYPYLRMKRKQAEVLMKFLQLYKNPIYTILVEHKLRKDIPHRYCGLKYHPKINPEIKKIQQNLCKMIRELNQKIVQPERLNELTPIIDGDATV